MKLYSVDYRLILKAVSKSARKVLEKLGLPSVLSCTLPASPSSVSMHCFSVSVASDTRMLY